MRETPSPVDTPTAKAQTILSILGKTRPTADSLLSSIFEALGVTTKPTQEDPADPPFLYLGPSKHDEYMQSLGLLANTNEE